MGPKTNTSQEEAEETEEMLAGAAQGSLPFIGPSRGGRFRERRVRREDDSGSEASGQNSPT